MSRLAAEIAEMPARLLAAAAEGADGVGRAAADWRRARPALVMTVARGTSDAAATFAARQLAAEAGILTGSFTPSLASVGGFTHAGEGLRVLAISQSGASPDLRAAVEAFAPPTRWALTNAAGSPLEEAAAIRIPMGAGPEESVAATKSFACSLLQLQALARALAGAAAPDPTAAAAGNRRS
ncbi:MAG: SIS domain-containing protein, partial [Betaproteobacteria bacterium AqS2]|nr:SIS domain-containing protein [Betaproteobacteria bacterium AqS2]